MHFRRPFACLWPQNGQWSGMITDVIWKTPGRSVLRLILFSILLWMPIRSLAEVAQVKVPLLEVGENTFTNAVLKKLSPTHVTVVHSRGTAMVKAIDLDPEMLRKLGYEPANVKKAAIQAAASRQAAPATVVPPAQAAAPSQTTATNFWFKNYWDAVKKSKEQKKNLLVLYTGGGREFARLQRTLAAPEFVSYAQSKLILVEQSPDSALQSGNLEYIHYERGSLGILGNSAEPNQAASLIGALEKLNKANAK
jgi:hypothetical protein